MKIDGRARVFGDDVNTDYIISSARKRTSIDADVLRAFLMESIDPAFATSVRPGDVIVAGRNFGCGSAMEVAVTVIQAAGIRAVVARSFARSFYRNAINNGLVVVECDTGAIAEGDRILLDMDAEGARVENLSTGRSITAAPLPGIMRDILDAGGLVPFLRDRERMVPE
jgi:3-isopropylmalate/(R)-2-methylmalate dehydratase small subunit